MKPDAKLLLLEAEFNAASDREENAADRMDELDAEYDRLRKRMREAQRKLDRRTQDGSRLFSKIMQTRAKSLDGTLAKLRVRKRWNTDDEASAISILKSLVKDLNGMSG